MPTALSVRRPLPAVLAAAAAVAVAGCASSSKSAAPASTPSAAAVTTAAAVASAPVADGSSAAAGTSDTGSVPDPCTLVTQSDVATALGSAVQPGQAQELTAPLGGKSCTWTTGSAPLHSIVISVPTDKTITVPGETAAVLLQQDVTTLGAAQGLTLQPALGDKGYVGYGKAGSDNAHVLEGDVLLDVIGLYGSTATSPATQAQFLALVKGAAAKL